MYYSHVTFGQILVRYKVPKDILTSINSLYEANAKNLYSANRVLAGKIKKQHALLYQDDIANIKAHDVLPKNIKTWFLDIFSHYLSFSGHGHTDININSMWINEMESHEYNPVHVHTGKEPLGLSSVMILKLPSVTGKEYSYEEAPTNGKLIFLGSSTGHFSKVDYTPKVEVGDFYVFPYDLRHAVYPFSGTNEVRRTLAANCDVTAKKQRPKMMEDKISTPYKEERK